MFRQLIARAARCLRVVATRDNWCSLPVLVGLIAVGPYTSLLVSGDLVLKDSLYSDYGSFQVPMREFAQSEFAAGRFPHWIPWVGCGIPMHATGQVGLCYPLLTPLLLLFSANMAIKTALLLHVVLCYVGQYRLSRSLALSPAGAALSGLIAAQSGFLTTHLAVGHVAHVLAYGLLPWFMGSVIAVCRRASVSSAAQFAICLSGLLLIGHPQIPYYALLFGGLWAMGSLCVGAAARHRVRVCEQFLLGLLVGLLMAAVQLIPTLELVRDNAGLTARGTVEYAGEYALDGLDLYRLFVPSLRGNPLVGIPEFQPPDFYHEKVCYLGLLTWCLALSALVSASRSHWPRGIAVLVVVGLVIALGRSTMLFEVVGSTLPGLFLFRCPGRCLAVVSVLVALLAGRGFDVWGGDDGPRTRWSVWSLVAIMVLTDVVILIDRSIDSLDWTRWSEFALHHLQPELHASGLALAFALAFVRWNHRLPARARCLLATLILAADLGFFNLRAIQYESDDRRPLPPPVLLDSEQFRFVEAPRYPNFSRHEVRYSRYVPQAVRAHVRMLGTNEGGILPSGCEVIYRELERDPAEALRLAACRDCVRDRNSGQWTQIDEPLPRIRFVPDASTTDVAHPPEPITMTNGLAVRTAQSIPVVEILADEPQRLLARVHTPSHGSFVVADTFYPGWTGLVDEKPVEVARLFNCFRGVRLPRGTHVVQMQFHSASFQWGRNLSALGVLSLLVLGCVDVRLAGFWRWK